MTTTINAKTLRASLPRVVARVRKGARYTVLYRSQPAFLIVPLDTAATPSGLFADDSLYRADAVGASTDGRASTDHDAVLQLRLRLGLSAAEMWWQQVDRSTRLRWERITVERFEVARHLFFKYRDKAFSFTDCTSFAVMQELKLTRALTTDRHFKQMGFQIAPGLAKR